MIQKKYPSLYITGVPKAGTSSIAEALGHSDLYHIGSMKEPKYFTLTNNAYRLNEKEDLKYCQGKPRSIEAYEECYKDDRLCPSEARVNVDCSADYFRHCSICVPNIMRVSSNAKFVVVLRDPIERAYSHYCNTRQLGREQLDFMSAIAAENSRITKGWGPAFHYINDSLYSESLKWFLDNKVHIDVYIYEEIFESNETFRKFLAKAFNIKELNGRTPKINVSRVPNESFYHPAKKAWNRLPCSITNNLAAKTVKNIVRHTFSAPKTRMSESEKNLLLDYFSDDMDQTFSLLGRSVSKWHKAV